MIEESRYTVRFRIPLKEEADVEELRRRVSRFVCSDLQPVGIKLGATHLRYDGLFIELTGLDLGRSDHRDAVASGNFNLLGGHEWLGDWPPLESVEYEI